MQYNMPVKKVIYNDHLFDSTGEANWQKLHDDSGIRCTPHPGTFRTGHYGKKEIVYSPDYYFCDYGWFGEYKPEGGLSGYDIQQKISAAMDGGFSPIANGLAIFGPLNDFEKNESKKLCLQGDFYQWINGAIAKRKWILGETQSGEVQFFLTDVDWDNDDSFARYPQFAKNPSVYVGRSYTDSRASEVIYRATFNAIFAKKNGLFTEVEVEETKQDLIEVFKTTKPFD